MDYIAFALKYRPQVFDQVIGQDHVVASLKNAILKKRVHHAYLFSGPRGVGKTSMARILAKSLNCEKGPTVTPCGKCPSCIEISKGTSLDIIEIDGASNRGIDEIRTLRENVKLSPAHSRFKVYIIDEVHMLTQEAFNALLKTLEEPPAHVKFIFATTHPQKVLPTILSRCQKFQFNLIAIEQITQKLKSIAKAEKVKIPETLLYAVARVAGGSIRDAESLFDQLVPVILEKGVVEDMFSFLGIIDEESLNAMLKSLVAKDLAASLTQIDKIVKDGRDLGVFLASLIEHARILLLAKVSVNSFKGIAEITPQTKELILEISKQISVSDILKLIDLFIEAKGFAQRLNTVRVPLELAVVKFSHNETEPQAIDEPPKKMAIKSPAQHKASSKTKQSTKSKVKPQEDDSGDWVGELEELNLEEDDQSPKVSNNASAQKDDEGGSDDMLLPICKKKWNDIVRHIQKVRAAIASHLSFSVPVSSAGEILRIGFAKKDTFHKEIVESAKNTHFIEEVVSKFIDKSVGVKFVISDSVKIEGVDGSKQESHKEAKKDESQPAVDNEKHEEFINELLDTFGGKIHTDD